MRRILLLLASGLLISAIVFSGGCAAQEPDTFSWRFYGTEDFASQNAPIWNECFEEIELKSEGRLDIEVLWLGEHPYEGFDMLDVVRDRGCELGHTQGLDLTGVEPIMGGISLLFLVPDLETGQDVNDRLNSELINPYLEDKYNLSILGAAVAGGQAVHASKILNSFEAMEGMRIRVFNKETADAIELMGGVPQTVEGAEVYEALDKGILDGALTATHYAYDQKWYEVVKFVTLWNEFVFTDNVLVNSDAFNELPDDLQTIVSETIKEYEGKVEDVLDEQAQAAVVKAQDEYGVTVEDIDQGFRSDVIELVQPVVWEDWADRVGDDLADPFFDIVNEMT